MQLLIVRHAPATPRGQDSIPDAARPLTPRGEARFRESARGIARLLPSADVVLSSPLLRARQTAEIAAEAWQGVRVSLETALAAGDLSTLLPLLARHAKRDVVALFGHEPQLSLLLAHLLGCDFPEAVAFRKGGAALVEVADPTVRGAAQLLWLLPPRILRRLGGGGDAGGEGDA
jgi:phosphohistidine phosphatase